MADTNSNSISTLKNNNFDEYIKHREPNFQQTSDGRWLFCVGVFCTDCAIAETCKLPGISKDKYEEIKKEHPEYFI